MTRSDKFALILSLCAYLAFYLPIRLKGMYALYGIQRRMLDPFLTEEVQSLAPALIIVHPDDPFKIYSSPHPSP